MAGNGAHSEVPKKGRKPLDSTSCTGLDPGFGGLSPDLAADAEISAPITVFAVIVNAIPSADLFTP